MKHVSDTFLGIELGSTRIKAVAINRDYVPVASGDWVWASSFEQGIWTYDIGQVWEGLNAALARADLTEPVACMGISGMMHGYLAFDRDWNLLVPFRTWQNTITAPAAAQLTELFSFNVPQRWSIAHLYQAILNQEEHVPRIAHITTLAGYVHYMLTGVNAIGIGEASGMFPIDSATGNYDRKMLDQFRTLVAQHNLLWDIEDVLPHVLVAGEQAGVLTEEGATRLQGRLPVGTPFAPPEGDAGTGMTATNSVAPRTGNISAGTSIFSMVVLEKPLNHVYEEIDIVTTPSGADVAMVHCNNCTNDSNAWVSLLHEATALLGADVPTGQVYTRLYEKSLEGDPDCGGVLVCNYLAGEGITHLDEGRPMVVRKPNSRFTLANFFRATLYSTAATLNLGMDILRREQVSIDSLTGHGGLFKTPLVGQKYMAAACNAPITCMQTAGEGGPYGMALLAAFAFERKEGQSLEDYLSSNVFKNSRGSTIAPDPTDVAGFRRYMKDFTQLLKVEESAVSNLR